MRLPFVVRCSSVLAMLEKLQLLFRLPSESSDLLRVKLFLADCVPSVNSPLTLFSGDLSNFSQCSHSKSLHCVCFSLNTLRTRNSLEGTSGPTPPNLFLCGRKFILFCCPSNSPTLRRVLLRFGGPTDINESCVTFSGQPTPHYGQIPANKSVSFTPPLIKP